MVVLYSTYYAKCFPSYAYLSLEKSDLLLFYKNTSNNLFVYLFIEQICSKYLEEF